jgi:hypothetical protein
MLVTTYLPPCSAPLRPCSSALIPGNSQVLDRGTNTLVNCTPALCTDTRVLPDGSLKIFNRRV